MKSDDTNYFAWIQISPKYNKKGFTLVELLVTIAILAVLATVSIVGYTSFIERAAVSNDENLVAQLNNYKNAYVIGMTEDLKISDIKAIIEDSGIGELKPQSEKYGYAFYFVKNVDKFVLLKTDDVNIMNENYLKLPEDLIEDSNDDDIRKPEPNEEYTEPSAPDEDDEIDPLNLMLADFDFIPYSSDSPYILALGGKLYVGINETEAAELDISKVVFTDGEKTFYVDGIMLNESLYNDTYTFNSVGKTDVKFKLKNTDIFVPISVIVENIDKDPNWSIEPSDKIENHISVNENGADILILQGMNFIMPQDGDAGLFAGVWGDEINLSDKKVYLTYFQISIVVNGKRYEIDTSNICDKKSNCSDCEIYKIDGGRTNAYIEEITSKPHSYTLIYELYDNPDGTGNLMDREIISVTP